MVELADGEHSGDYPERTEQERSWLLRFLYHPRGRPRVMTNTMPHSEIVPIIMQRTFPIDKFGMSILSLSISERATTAKPTDNVNIANLGINVSRLPHEQATPIKTRQNANIRY
jgi:hypothetical protein